MNDPWDWDVNRVVQEFCTPNRSWKPNKEPPALPPLDELETFLREQETDGFTLLTYPNRDELHRELGVKKLNQKATFSNAIEQFRKRSLKYQRYQLGQEDSLENPPADQGLLTPQPQSTTHTGEGTKKRLLVELASLQSLNNSEQRPEATEVIAPDKSLTTTPASVPAPPTEPTTTPLNANEPPQKKRRITPTIVSTDIDVNAKRSIPTAADDILGVSSNASSAPIPVIDPSDAYLGMDAVTRIEIAELDSPVTGGPLTQDDRTFHSVYNNSLPRGRQLQMYRLFKRRLLPKQTPDRLIPTKSDTVFGANDPNRDEVLPIYGESESEYDSETWEEMEAELDERAAAGTVSTGLEMDRVNSVIDEEIQNLVDRWREHRLPKLGRTAYKVWSQPRKRGYLRIAIDNERQLIRDLEGRLTKYREKILEQQFYKEAEIRSMCRIFEQTVDEKEAASWKVSVLSSSKEPEKLAHVSRAPSKKPRKAQPVGDDDSEILTSEDEDLGDFIVDIEDDPHLAGNGGDSPMSNSDYYSPTLGSPVANDARNGTTDKHDSTDPLTLTQFNNTRIPGILNYPRTPSKSQRAQPTIIDLTVTPDKRPMSTGDFPLRREQTNSAIRIKLPKLENRSSQSSSMKHKLKGRSSLIMDIDDLNDKERATTEQLQKLSPKFLSIIFTVAEEMKPDLIWKDFILPALEAPVFPRTQFSDEEMDIVVAFRLLRLFDFWLEEVNYTWQQYKQLSDAEKKKIVENGEKKQEDFGRFIDFINRISDRFEWTKARTRKKNEQGGSSALVTTKPQAAVEPNSDIDDYGTAGEDINADVADGSPSKKKKRRKVLRNQEARNLREIDRVQMIEQEVRRNQLRAQLEKLEASGAAIGSQRAMIINESKEDDEGFIYVHDEIAPRIKEHQVAGVRFMWNQVVAKSGSGQGCLLAHTMGLGKTMQIITLLVTISQAASSDDGSIRSQIPDHLQESKTLILCPPTLVNNWLDELLFWTPEGHGLGMFFKVDSQMPPRERGPTILHWAETGGILVIGYSLLKRCMDDEDLQLTLTEAPNLVVADEAHFMKNPTSKTHIATSNFKTKSRIALTGSPLANNVEEYHSMINWVAPNYLSDITEFRQTYATPIREGLSVESTRNQRRFALSRLHALKKTVGPKVHRLTIAVLKNDIPPKTEFVLVVPLTDVQKVAYEIQLGSQQNTNWDEIASSTIFAALNILGILCAHPHCFLKHLEQRSSNKVKSKDDQEFNVALPANLVSDQISYLRKTKNIDWLFHSWKIPMLTAILDESRNVGDSVLVFSQSITTLDYLENILRGQKRTVQRLDGSTAMNSRQAMVKDFNKNAAEVFLISTTAGGLGLNITGANRVVIFDFKFNPQHEQQAIGRAYRLGQTKPVFVYRFVCGGTFEETLLSRSIFKMQLSDRVIDKRNPIPKASHFGELFKMPSDPEQKDLSAYRGRDIVVDKILDSDVLRPGLRSIILMDTFQEESLEDSQLSQDEKNEADRLIAQHEARRNGKPFDMPPPVAQGYGVGASSSQPMSGNIAIPSTNYTTHTATPSLPTQVTNEQIDQPDLEQRLQPTMGASTGIRKGGQGTELRASAFKSELKRLFGIDSVAQAIVDAVEGQDGQRSFESQNSAKWAIVEAAGSPRFVEAVETGILSPQELATFDATTINLHRDRYDAASEESWAEQTSNSSHGADPEHLHNALRKMSSTPKRDSGSSQKSHRMDDVMALRAVMARRQSNKPRLPNWAREAVANEGKQGRIAPPSSEPTPSPSTSAPRPLPRSPFT